MEAVLSVVTPQTGYRILSLENEVTVQMPEKKPKGKELTSEQKKGNRKISGFRVLVEHAIWETGLPNCQKPFMMPQVWVRGSDHGAGLWVTKF